MAFSALFDQGLGNLIPMEEDVISLAEDTSSSSSQSSDQSDNEGSENEDLQQVDALGPNAEMEIEGDFEGVGFPPDRLVNNIRLKEGTSGGLLAKEWDFNIQEQDAQFRDDLRAASGIGKRRKMGRAAGPSLSYEVKSLLGDGNQAYVDANLPEAIRIMLEVIRIEPRAASAWSVLAQCHEDMGQHQQALQLRIMAAHLRHDADEWDRLARQSKELGFQQQAIYCWGKLTSLDPSNINAQWDRALLARELGDLKTTRNAFLAILKRFPHDLVVLSEIRTILVELSDLDTCATLFKAAFEYYQNLYPAGHGPHPTTHNDDPGGGFGLLEILVLADLYNTSGEHGRAIDVIRRGCRWLQGRGHQRYWDMCDDDREYDLVEFNRSVDSGPQPGMFALDVNARHRLAVARIKMGEIQEARLHVGAVISEDILDYAPLFVEIADAYFERQMYAEARPIYGSLGAEASTSSLYILLQTAVCLRMLNELREAAEVYEYIRQVEPTHNEAKMKLAEVYEILNEPRKALELVYEVIDSRRLRNKTSDANAGESGTASQLPASSLFAEEKASEKSAKSKPGRSRMTVEALKELEAAMEADTLKTHQRLTELYPKISADEINDAERDWTIQAEKLLEGFRETRQLFSTTQHAFRGMFPTKQRANAEEADEVRIASRLHLGLESSSATARAGTTDVFRGLRFQDWLQLFLQYCFLLTRRGQFGLAEEILRHILLSVPYRSVESQTSIRLAIIACAVMARRFALVVEHSRRLMAAHQFNNEPMRIFMASLASGLHATDAFMVSPLQKAMYREIKLYNFTVKTPELVKWIPHLKRFGLPNVSKEEANEEEDADEQEEGSTTGTLPSARPLPLSARKRNPVIAVLYAHMCIAAKSYQSAIFYLLYAYELCPSDPLICLSLAIASLGRAMQRQSDNRHQLITQAMASLALYRQERKEQVNGAGEIDFNFGRAFQQIGLFSHAATHYEKVLERAEAQDSKSDTLAPEAAYNLALIYATTGAIPLAKALYRRWLAL